MLARRLLALGALVLSSSCSAASGQPRTGDHDVPVPPGEPRGELSLIIDLTPAQECEERFDLALYTDRRIDLIAWDDQTGACSERQVTIRYLSAKINAEQLLDQVRKLVERVRRGEPARPAAQPPAAQPPSTQRRATPRTQHGLPRERPTSPRA
jgi:hypothetical protein